MKTSRRRLDSPGGPQSMPLHSRRRGTILIYGLVCLALLGAGTLAATQLTLAAARFRQADESAAQADWLADAGLTLAVSKLREAADYTGEVWEPQAADTGLERPARVTIRIDPPTEAEGRTMIRVESRYPADSPRVVTAVRTGWTQLSAADTD